MATPTKFAIEYTCGHTKNRDLSDVDAGKRKSRANWYGQNFTCPDCFKAEKGAQDRKDANQRALDAEAFAGEHGLPELKGSEKQIMWGSIIRHETVEAVVEEYPQRPEILEAAQGITHAGWWLDNLNWDDRKKHDYGPEEYAELILTGPAAQAERDQNHIETENPYE